MPVANPANDVPLILVTVDVKLPVPVPVTSPIKVIVPNFFSSNLLTKHSLTLVKCAGIFSKNYVNFIVLTVGKITNIQNVLGL